MNIDLTMNIDLGNQIPDSSSLRNNGWCGHRTVADLHHSSHVITGAPWQASVADWI
jgi:hypothetical protein